MAENNAAQLAGHQSRLMAWPANTMAAKLWRRKPTLNGVARQLGNLAAAESVAWQCGVKRLSSCQWRPPVMKAACRHQSWEEISGESRRKRD